MCIAHCRSRPWEPEKFSSRQEQDENLENLLQWVRAYETRTDEYGFARHRELYESFQGKKREFNDPSDYESVWQPVAADGLLRGPPLNRGVIWNKMIDRSALLRDIKTAFPEIRNDINGEMGLLHMEVGVFCRYAQDCIDKGDEKAVRACFRIAESAYKGGNSSVKNAIDVSFVEALAFRDSEKSNRKWAWELFPERLKRLYLDFHGKNHL